MILQFCIWANGFQTETCAPLIPLLTSPGTYYVDLGKPSGWWKLNGVYNWAQRPTNAQIMVKDNITQTLLMSQLCGAFWC